MKKLFIIQFILMLAMNANSQIIADHTIVDKYDKIPANWIDSVKTKLVYVTGMSHGNGFFRSMLLLNLLDTKYPTEIWFHTDPLIKTISNIRIGRPYWGAESIWTSQTGITNFVSTLDRQNNTGNQYDIFIFGWSYQGTWINPPGGSIDPVYNVHWAGNTDGSPDGERRWGLDAGDSTITGNRVCVDTYINAWKQYIDHFESTGANTKMVYSTLAVDGDQGTETAFQRELKSQHIRDYVAQDANLILFDYADILVHNNAGEVYTVNWNDGGNLRPHQQIHPDNLMDYDGNWNIINAYSDALKTILPGEEDHIGDVGALRLGKAMWWMLARIAGWDGGVATGNEEVAAQVDPAIVSVSGEELRIEMKDPANLPNRVSIHNLQGSTVSHKDNPGSTCSFSTAGLPSGIYLVVISGGGINKTQKIFIQ